jgi:hypothetical protein
MRRPYIVEAPATLARNIGNFCNFLQSRTTVSKVSRVLCVSRALICVEFLLFVHSSTFASRQLNGSRAGIPLLQAGHTGVVPRRVYRLLFLEKI